MNIFRILSSNDGTINEPNVSSFLAYLLNPNEDHGISSLLLQEILNDIILTNKDFLSKVQSKGRITDLSKYSGYTINVIPELSVNPNKEGKKKRRDIDIVIEIIDTNNPNEIIYSICIENKITDSSINKNDSQLKDELEGIENYYNESKSSPEIHIIYLTPFPSDVSTASFDKLGYDKKHHLYWDKHKNSIFNKILKIFKEEDKGLIDPINNQSSYLIKSFLSFIKTDFKSYIEERKEKKENKNYGKPVIDHLNDFSKTLEFDKEYDINTIKKGFSEYVLKESKIELHKGTGDRHITLSIVNEKNRRHFNVKNPNDARRNIFYYSDALKKYIKLFTREADENIKIYYKGVEGIEFITLKELSQK